MSHDEATVGLMHVPGGNGQTSQWEDEGCPTDRAPAGSGIPSELLESHGRNWPDFGVGDLMMIKGTVFQAVDIVNGGLVVKPYVGNISPTQAKRIVADMIPKR